MDVERYWEGVLAIVFGILFIAFSKPLGAWNRRFQSWGNKMEFPEDFSRYFIIMIAVGFIGMGVAWMIWGMMA